MLFTSVIDPALLDELAEKCREAQHEELYDDESPTRQWCGLLRHLLRAIKHSHTLLRVPDIQSETRAALRKLQGVDPQWYQLVDAVVNDAKRIVDVDNSPVVIGTETPDADNCGSRKALALRLRPFCDMVLTGETGFLIKAELQQNGAAECDLEKIVTPASYQFSEGANVHADGWGGIWLKGPPDVVLKNWFEPFFRWAEKVTIVDRYVGPACMQAAPFALDAGLQPAGSNATNRLKSWQTFKVTLARINSAWCQNGACQKREFEVVTASAPSDLQNRDATKWEEYCPDKSPSKQGWCEARYVHEQLVRGSGITKLRVTLVDADELTKENRLVAHDRWLIDRTRDRALNLSRGFDLFVSSTTKPCMVSFMRAIPAKTEVWSLADIAPWATYRPVDAS